MVQMTLEEYLAIPMEAPYFEYFDGEVTRKPFRNRPGLRVMTQLIVALGEHADAHNGETGPSAHVWFESAHHWRVPDVVYWAPGKPQGDDDVSLPPTLAVEILSPGQTMQDLRDKCRFYRANGVDVAWAVNPDTRTVEAFEGEWDGIVLREGDTLTAAALPGFELSLTDLFAVLDRP